MVRVLLLLLLFFWFCTIPGTGGTWYPGTGTRTGFGPSRRAGTRRHITRDAETIVPRYIIVPIFKKHHDYTMMLTTMKAATTCPGPWRVPAAEARILRFILTFLRHGAQVAAPLLVVGGYVRDLLLGKVPDDLDLAICLSDCAPEVTVAALVARMPALLQRTRPCTSLRSKSQQYFPMKPKTSSSTQSSVTYG